MAPPAGLLWPKEGIVAAQSHTYVVAATLRCPMPNIPSDIAFSDSVKAQQARRGSRRMDARVEAGDGWPDSVTPDLAQFISGITSFYLSTASATGQPYIQRRGGPAGFLKVIDDKTLGFADYGGNRQYITLGNLAENPR